MRWIHAEYRYILLLICLSAIAFNNSVRFNAVSMWMATLTTIPSFFFISFCFIFFAAALLLWGIFNLQTSKYKPKQGRAKNEEKTTYMIQFVDSQHLCRSNMAYVRFYFIDINIEAQQGNILWSQMFSIVSMLNIYELQFQCYTVHNSIPSYVAHRAPYQFVSNWLDYYKLFSFLFSVSYFSLIGVWEWEPLC